MSNIKREPLPKEIFLYPQDALTKGYSFARTVEGIPDDVDGEIGVYELKERCVLHVERSLNKVEGCDDGQG